jgi:hypothetical protein
VLGADRLLLQPSRERALTPAKPPATTVAAIGDLGKAAITPNKPAKKAP